MFSAGDKSGTASTYRVYFNRWNDFPLVWSVDEGSQASEVNVSQVVLDGVSGKTARGTGDNVNSPTVWIEVAGYLRIEDQVATISREPFAMRPSLEAWVLPPAVHARDPATRLKSSAANGSR